MQLISCRAGFEPSSLNSRAHGLNCYTVSPAGEGQELAQSFGGEVTVSEAETVHKGTGLRTQVTQINGSMLLG